MPPSIQPRNRIGRSCGKSRLKGSAFAVFRRHTEHWHRDGQVVQSPIGDDAAIARAHFVDRRGIADAHKFGIDRQAVLSSTSKVAAALSHARRRWGIVRFFVDELVGQGRRSGNARVNQPTKSTREILRSNITGPPPWVCATCAIGIELAPPPGHVAGRRASGRCTCQTGCNGSIGGNGCAAGIDVAEIWPACAAPDAGSVANFAAFNGIACTAGTRCGKSRSLCLKGRICREICRFSPVALALCVIRVRRSVGSRSLSCYTRRRAPCISAQPAMFNAPAGAPKSVCETFAARSALSRTLSGLLGDRLQLANRFAVVEDRDRPA